MRVLSLRPLLLLLTVTACSTPEPTPALVRDKARQTDFLHEPISSIRVDAEGDAWISFGKGPRLFVIPRENAEMLAFAREAEASGAVVYATVRAGHGDKATEFGPPVDAAGKRNIAVLRLATTPDPELPK